MFACIFCNDVESKSEDAMQEHQKVCPRRTVMCTHCKEYQVPEVVKAVPAEDYAALCERVREMHLLMSQLASALNNPMLKAMLPPQMRGMLGG